MSDEDEEEHGSFKPASGPVDQRIAAALEYIATQLGQINRKLDYLTGVYEEDDEEED